MERTGRKVMRPPRRVIDVERKGAKRSKRTDQGHAASVAEVTRVEARGSKSKSKCKGSSTASVLAIVHFGSVGRLCGLFERSKAT